MLRTEAPLLCACRRPAYQFEAERIEGAVNIPTFRPVAGKGKWDILKKVAMGALAMKATGQRCIFSRPPCDTPAYVTLRNSRWRLVIELRERSRILAGGSAHQDVTLWNNRPRSLKARQQRALQDLERRQQSSRSKCLSAPAEGDSDFGKKAAG